MSTHSPSEFTHYFWPPGTPVSRDTGIVEQSELQPREIREVIGTLGTIRLINDAPEGIATMELLSMIENAEQRIHGFDALNDLFYRLFIWNQEARHRWLGLHKVTSFHIPTHNPGGEYTISNTAHLRVDHKDLGRELFKIHIPHR